MPLTFTAPPPIHAPTNPTTLAGRLLQATTPPTNPTSLSTPLPLHPEAHQNLRHLLTELDNEAYGALNRLPLPQSSANSATHTGSPEEYNYWLRENRTRFTEELPRLTRLISELATTLIQIPPASTPASTSLYTEEQLNALISELSTPAPGRGHIIHTNASSLTFTFPAATFFNAITLGPFTITLSTERLQRNYVGGPLSALTFEFPSYHSHFTRESISSAHPHLNSNRIPCFGNFYNPLADAIRTCNLRELLSLLHQWIYTYNSNSPYPGRNEASFTSLPPAPASFPWPHSVESLNAPQDPINHGEAQEVPQNQEPPTPTPAPVGTPSDQALNAAIEFFHSYLHRRPNTLPAPHHIEFIATPDPAPTPTPSIQFLPPNLDEPEPAINLDEPEPAADDDDA